MFKNKMYGRKKKHIVKSDLKKQTFGISRILLITGIIACVVGIVTVTMAMALPYWVYLRETMETTVAGLTDATEVTYNYGLWQTCLVMTATHLDYDDCGNKDLSTLSDWELTTFITLGCSIFLLLFAIVQAVLNICCWNKLVFLILSTTSAVAAGIVAAVGVSLYQIKATVQTLDIGGLTTADFEPRFLSVCFWLAFGGAILGMMAGLLLMIGTFTRKKPKEPRHIIGTRYKTTVRPVKCPYRGRQPGNISITNV